MRSAHRPVVSLASISRLLAVLGAIATLEWAWQTVFAIASALGLAVSAATRWVAHTSAEWSERADDYLGRVGDWLKDVEP